MEGVAEFFRHAPLLALFLTLGLGFWVGRLRIGSFALGSIPATLIVGVIFGQMHIVIPDMVKTVFFLLFIFSVGYGVGPQFFRSFRQGGVKMLLFAVTTAAVCAGLVLGAAALFGYDSGIATGLFAGSQTVSASLGLVSDIVREMPVSAGSRERLLAIIPACYAMTYVFGTVGSAWFMAKIAPAMLGGLDKVKAEVAEIEQRMDSTAYTSEPGMIPARRPVVYRAYDVSDAFYDTPKTPAQISAMYEAEGKHIVVVRARIDGKVCDPSPDMLISKCDHMVLGGRAENMVALGNPPGQEVADSELLNFGAERTPVTIALKAIDGITLGELRRKDFMERIVVSSIHRTGLAIPAKNNTELHQGDILTLVGWQCDVAEAAKRIGYADRDSNTTDMVFVGLGIALGCAIGALSIKVAGIPLSLGVSVGALLAGLTLGWYRTRRPSFGHIPASALWIFNNLGVNMFIAILGITAGAALMRGLGEAGWTIILVGAALTLLGLVINIFIARKIFRFSAPDTLGCVAGSRCCVAAIGSVCDTLDSQVPNLSFTICFAVANISLVFSALIVLFLV